MNIKETTKLRRLLRKAQNSRGSERAQYQAEIRSKTREVSLEVNRRLRSLEKSGYNYGAAWDWVKGFQRVEDVFGKPVDHPTAKDLHFRFPTSFKNDYEGMVKQTNVGLRFLSMKGSSVEGAAEIEANRMATFIKLGIFSESSDYDTRREYLRFIGSEEYKTAVTELYYEDLLELGAELFENLNGDIEDLKADLARYNAGKYGEATETFDVVMKRYGVNVAEYGASNHKRSHNTGFSL